MGEAAKDILGLGVPGNGDLSIRWTPADPDFREFLDHIAEILARKYIEIMEATADPKDADIWKAAVQGKGDVPETPIEEGQPG